MTPEELIKGLGGRDASMRLASRDELVKRGPKVVPALVIEARDGHRRAAVTGVFAKMGRTGVTALLPLLSDPEAGQAAGSLLFQVIGTDSADLAAPLLECLHDPAVNNYCGGALVKAMSPNAAGSVPLLRKAMADRDPVVRTYAAAALGRVGPKAAPAAAELAKGLKAPEAAVRAAAATALGAIGIKTPEIVAALRAAKKDPDVEARRAAADALKRLHV